METAGHRSKMSIIYILNKAEKSCGDVLSMIYFIRAEERSPFVSQCEQSLPLKESYFGFFFLNCVFATLTFESSLLSVWYLKHPAWLSDAYNYEVGEKK